MRVKHFSRRGPRSVAVVAGAVAIALVAACGGSAGTTGQPDAAAETTTIKSSVGYYPGALLSLPAFIAYEHGFFRDNGLDMTLVSIPNGAAMTAALASGSIQFGNNSYDNLSTAVARGLPLKAVTGSAVRVPFGLIARKGVPLPHLKDGYPKVMQDLLGKKSGVIALGVSVQFLYEELLTGAGHAPNDVTFLAVGLPGTARPALENGTVDTYLSLEPLPSIVVAQGQGTVVVNLAKGEGPARLNGLNYNGWWANDKTIDKNPDEIKRFARANEQAFCWYSDPKNLGAVVSITKKYVPVPELNDEQYTEMVKNLLPTYGVGITSESIATWQDILKSHGQLDKALTRDKLVAPTAPENFTC